MSKTYYDAGCFIGNWPFRKIHKGKITDLIAEHKKNGLGGGLVGCLDSVFFNDPYEGDEEVAKLINDCGYYFAATVNPLLPWAVDDLDRIKNDLKASAIRLYPSDHGFRCDDEKVIAVAKRAGELGLKVVITVRTEDIRIDYCFKQVPVDVKAIVNLAKACPDTKILASNIFIGEAFAIAPDLNALDNLWVDMARFNHMVFVVEKALEKIDARKIIFASGFPLLTLKCMLLNLEYACISDEIKEQIISSNFEDFIK